MPVGSEFKGARAVGVIGMAHAAHGGIQCGGVNMTQRPRPDPASSSAEWWRSGSQVRPIELVGDSPASTDVAPAGVRQPALPADQLERIIRRAARLQNRGDDHGQGRLTTDEVIRIAEEVGLEAQYVRRAIAELHAETLIPEQVPEDRLWLALAGTSRVQVRRVMAGDVQTLQPRIEALLRDRENLTALREGPSRSFWEPARGVSSRVKRKLSDRTFTLAKTRSVDLGIGQLEPGWSLVTVTADIANQRKDLLETPVLWLGVGALITANVAAKTFGFAAASIGGVLVGAGAAAVGTVLSVYWLRRKLAEKRQRVAMALDGVLDASAVGV
jgi:hypothetical protein